MKLFYFKTLAVLFALCTMHMARSQDIHFSQFYEAPLYRNPALAGIVNGDIRVQAVYRSQWNSVANAFKTGSLNAEYKMPMGSSDDYMTLGMQVFYDRAGTTEFTSTLLMPALNYHKSISADHNMYLSVGFMGGLAQHRINRSKITTNNQYDGGGDGETFNKANYSYFDGAAGISFNAGLGANPENNMVLGVAYHHFNRPTNSFYGNPAMQLQPKWIFSADLKMAVTDASYITLRTDHSRQGSYTETIAGMMYGLKIGTQLDHPDYAIHGGAFLRWKDAIIPTIKLDYAPYSVTLSYDVNISQLKTTSYGRGGMELSLTYIGFLDRNNSTLNAVRCPRF